jgi:hypothetical protein
VGNTAPPNELIHYGVKGMKWGVRKDDPYRSTESKSLRKESARNLNNYMWNAIADEPIFGKTMTKEEYKALSTKGETFVKNTKFRRITPNSEAVVKGNTYVSTLMKDSDFYRAAIPSVGPNTKGLGGGGRKAYKQKHYEIEMKATKKLSSPSEKERVDAFIELLEEPSIQIKSKKAPITGRAYLERTGYKPLFKRYETQELAFKAWDEFTSMQGNQDNPLAKAYFEKIKSRGYNAIIDDNDRGKYTDKPLVLLDPESTIKINTVRRLTADEINQAQRRLKVP